MHHFHESANLPPGDGEMAMLNTPSALTARGAGPGKRVEAWV